MKSIITMPRTNPYDLGARDAMAAVETGMDYLSAYSMAVGEMVNYKDPMAYLRGFNQTYKVEEAKQAVA